MRFPQVLIYEGDGRLAALLRETLALGQGGDKRRWALRSPRLASSCLRLLRGAGPSVLVLKLGRDPKRHEMPLLEQVTWLYPDTATVVVSELDNPALAGLAWDLGARCVLFPPQTRDQLPGVVAGLMEAMMPKK